MTRCKAGRHRKAGLKARLYVSVEMSVALVEADFYAVFVEADLVEADLQVRLERS